MNHTPHCTDFPQDILLSRRILLLVICLFVGALISLSVTSMALADDDDDEHNSGGGKKPKVDFVIPMNYELGMHCTGFEFAYCCVLPAYNSILAQVIKTQDGEDGFAQLLEGDPNVGKDFLGRETVLRDPGLDDDDNFKKYVLKYEHHAQPRVAAPGSPGNIGDTLISDVELNSLLSWNTVFDAAATDSNGALVTGDYHGAKGVVLGDGDYTDANDNYQNGVWNHLYFYTDLEGNFTCVAGDTNKHCSALSSNPDAECDSAPGAGDGVCGVNTDEDKKIRLGMPNVDSTGFSTVYPVNSGPAFHPMGPDGSDLNNVLTFSTDDGTVVFTQMKVLENLPVMLTSPRIWEALGLPLTPFEDSIDFFGNPGLVDEQAIRPYVKMQATMHHFDPNEPDGAGAAVIDSNGNEVVAFGTAPIDIPNCERCHSAPAEDENGNTNINSPNVDPVLAALVDQEVAFWKAYYPSMAVQGNSDWYARLKGAAISILSIHDDEHGTSFTKVYSAPGFVTTPAYPGADCPSTGSCAGADLDIESGNPGLANDLPQNTRLGNESVICQKCHADNVIAVVKSANCGPLSNCDLSPADELFSNIAVQDVITGEGHLIKPLTEAIHWNHRNVSEGGNIVFNDAQGRDGGCQGCHPAHRSDGDMDGYPITLDGDNLYDGEHNGFPGDNRQANGGCFVGRDVHSNPMKDTDGAETPEHLNAVGTWLAENVANDGKGIWCTNCHSQLGQELWKTENCEDLIHGDCTSNPRAEPTLAAVATAVGLQDDPPGPDSKTAEEKAIAWLDPKNDPDNPTAPDPNDQTHAIWAPDPGICAHVASALSGGTISPDPAQDGNVATIEVAIGSADGTECSTGIGLPGPNCGLVPDGSIPGGADFFICGSLDGENDVSVSLVTIGNYEEDGSGDLCVPGVDTQCFAQSSPFCTTSDCVLAAQEFLDGLDFSTNAFPVPMSAATDGRDHWLSPGEPHCADCHEAPYVEQSGNISAYPPFNYPRKASLMRYTRGHRDISCQGCHESIHGLYPVTPNIDTTSYAQAAQWNADDSHGPLKCQTCHRVNSDGVHDRVEDLEYDNGEVEKDFDRAVGWMHTFTDEHDPTQDWCQNCHEDETDEVCKSGRGEDAYEKDWLEHARKGRASRKLMDQVENELCGNVAGMQRTNENPLNTVCQGCHDFKREDREDVTCSGNDGREWKQHLTEGRVAESVWISVSNDLAGSTCGW